MDLVKEYKNNSVFKNEKAILESLTNVFMLGTIKSEYKKNQTIDNKEEINELIIHLLENLLSNDFVTNQKDKLTIINLLDEFNYRNEILELIKKKNNSELIETSNRLGSKFISSHP